MLSRFVKVAVLAIPVVMTTGCASMTRVPTYGLEPSGTALVRQACSEVMGIGTAFAEFDACADSLAQSVRIRDEAHLISRASAHCEREGLEPGTPGLAKCVIQSKRFVAEGGSAAAAPVLVSDGPPARSYYSVSVSQQNERMELS